MSGRMRARTGRRYVILGNGIAGISAAEEIRRRDAGGQVTILSDETALGYSRVMLPLYIAGKRSARDLIIAPRAFYATQAIRLRRGEAVEAVDAGGQIVQTSAGRRIPYDRLLVATGSAPRRLDVPGAGLPGVCALRTLRDADAIKRALGGSQGPVVIVGGGLVGVKSLEALARTTREKHLVIASDRILSQMLDRTASDVFLQAFQRAGVRVHLHADVVAFRGRDRLEAVCLSDGTEVPGSLAIVGKGVHPSVACLQGSGIAVNEGVRVDERMATSVPAVYAAGDVAEPLDVLQNVNRPSAIWPSASEGGRIAGSNMAGTPAAFTGAIRMNAVDILGVRAIAAGDREGAETHARLRAEEGVYRKLLFSEGRLTGFLVLGDIRGAGVLTALVKTRAEVSVSALTRDLDRGFSYRPRLSAALGHAARTAAWGGMAQ